MIPEGGFGPAAGVVVAESVLAKHDERYIPQGRGRGPQGQGRLAGEQKQLAAGADTALAFVAKRAIKNGCAQRTFALLQCRGKKTTKPGSRRPDLRKTDCLRRT